MLSLTFELETIDTNIPLQLNLDDGTLVILTPPKLTHDSPNIHKIHHNYQMFTINLQQHVPLRKPTQLLTGLTTNSHSDAPIFQR